MQYKKKQMKFYTWLTSAFQCRIVIYVENMFPSMVVKYCETIFRMVWCIHFFVETDSLVKLIHFFSFVFSDGIFQINSSFSGKSSSTAFWFTFSITSFFFHIAFYRTKVHRYFSLSIWTFFFPSVLLLIGVEFDFIVHCLVSIESLI